MQMTIQGMLYISIHLITTPTDGVGTVIISILQMRKPSHRDIEQLT